jgi:DNA-directed RNA polymerase subunit RPC12/RpoP
MGFGAIGAFVGKAAGRIIHAASGDQKLKCARCKKITEHASRSNVDSINEDTSLDMIGKITLSAAALTHDFTPGIPLVIGNLYICCDCGLESHHGGVFSGALNERNRGV